MTRSREDVERILRERAVALAKPIDTPVVTAQLELLVLSLGAERHGVETAHVVEVLPLRDLTRVPCTPAFVLGVVNHRGRILAVLDFRRLFDLPGDAVPPGSRVVAVEAGGMTFGIFAEAVSGPIAIDADELAPPPVSLGADRRAFIRGVTRAMIGILDLEALARDPRIQVNDETE